MQPKDSVSPIPVAIRTEPIELSQFLKVAQLVMSGGEAKALVQSGAVKVNGAVEIRRSRKLVRADVVEVAGYGVFQVALDGR